MPPYSAALLTCEAAPLSIGLVRRGTDDRHAAMDVRVDAAGNDDLPRSIDRPPGPDRGQTARRADRDDLPARHADIGRFGRPA